MNSDTLKGQWTQLKGKVREKWGKLTDDDVDTISGQAQQLVGKIQERYGIAREEAQRQFDAWKYEERQHASRYDLAVSTRANAPLALASALHFAIDAIDIDAR